MLYYVAFLTAILVILSGGYVLARGDWRKLGLKFAGVCLATLAAIWLFGATYFFGANIFTCPTHLAESSCITLQLYFIIRNLAFVVFNMAVGRDAIMVRRGERRGTGCQTISLKPSPH